MCGFDSIPADIGTFFMASEVRKRHASGVAEVQAFVVAKGSVSGGTIASGLTIARAPGSSKMNDPMFLVPEDAVSHVAKKYDFSLPFKKLGGYAMMFVMGAIVCPPPLLPLSPPLSPLLPSCFFSPAKEHSSGAPVSCNICHEREGSGRPSCFSASCSTTGNFAAFVLLCSIQLL
jgi:hypothetical protein